MANLIEIETVLSSVETLFTLPDLCLRLRQLVDNPESSMAEMARLIATDTALTARLLQLVNSPIYYTPRKVASVPQAISLIGTEQLCNLALATSAASIIRAAEGGYLEMKTFWQHSVYTGLIAKNIIDTNFSGGESLFVAGLLHNIGKLAAVEYAPDIAMSAINGQKKGQFSWQREIEVYGYSMAAVGGALLAKWSLPGEIVVPVLWQHDPANGGKYLRQSCAIHIAVRIASEIMADSRLEADLDYRGSIEADSFSALGLSQNDIAMVIAGVKDTGPGVLQIFSW